MKKSDNLIFGRNPVKEAILSDRVVRLYISRSIKDNSLLELAHNHHLVPMMVSNEELDRFCEGVHQGVAADIKRYEYLSLDNILGKIKKIKNPVIVMLDGINDPHNFGAILRSCDVFNVSAIIISKHNQVPLNATVAKTSAGAINYVPVVLVNNLNAAISVLKDNGFWVVSADGQGTTNYHELNYDFPTVLVVGSEGKGISQLVLRNSDYIVKIPLLGHVNSLNASVATGILLGRIKNS